MSESVGRDQPVWLGWGLLAAGLLALYLPTAHRLFTGVWATDGQAHGPIVFAIGLWLIARKWSEAFGASAPLRPAALAGWACMAIGALAYAIGRSQNVPVLEVGSFIWFLAGLTLLNGGAESFKAMLFPLFFLIFMIPLPGTIVDALTLPMKIAVSHVAEEILSFLGYPIARSGVVLQIGQYKLLVADACAGLHTLFTLEALGLLYLNLVRHPSAFRNVTLAILIVPISFAANTIRVIALTLITYYLGDEAGQGFLHGFAGMLLFLSALLLIILLDSVLRFGEKRISRQQCGEAKSCAEPCAVGGSK